MGGPRLGKALRRPSLLEGSQRAEGVKEKREIVTQMEKVDNRRERGSE